MITNVGTVAIYVEDQQKAKEFWTAKAGFEVRAEHPMGPNVFWLEVASKNAHTRLLLYPKSMMPGSDHMKASIMFECDDVMKTYETMKANGVDFLDEPEKMEWGTFVKFHDEEGNEFLIKG